jgi:imidazole glycerol-phosphate synthase subunit HisH
MIGIIDYGAGNIMSVSNALSKIGVEYFVSSDRLELDRAYKLIMPGVGEALTAMMALGRLDLVAWLKERTVPFLGICLGMQVLFSRSEERDTECLGIVEGTITKFNRDADTGDTLKIPHMGWNTVHMLKDDPLFRGIADESYFYFVHSYRAPVVSDTSGRTTYGDRFTSVVRRRNYAGVQFHPEKSGPDGLTVLKNFIES